MIYYYGDVCVGALSSEPESLVQDPVRPVLLERRVRAPQTASDLDAALDTSSSPAPSRCFEDSCRGSSRVDGVRLERPRRPETPPELLVGPGSCLDVRLACTQRPTARTAGPGLGARVGEQSGLLALEPYLAGHPPRGLRL